MLAVILQSYSSYISFKLVWILLFSLVVSCSASINEITEHKKANIKKWSLISVNGTWQNSEEEAEDAFV